MSGQPNQPVDVKDSKQTYSRHSQELKKLTLIIDLSRLVGTKSTLGYQCVLHVTEIFVILVDQQSMKESFNFTYSNW